MLEGKHFSLPRFLQENLLEGKSLAFHEICFINIHVVNGIISLMSENFHLQPLLGLGKAALCFTKVCSSHGNTNTFQLMNTCFSLGLTKTEISCSGAYADVVMGWDKESDEAVAVKVVSRSACQKYYHLMNKEVAVMHMNGEHPHLLALREVFYSKHHIYIITGNYQNPAVQNAYIELQLL